VIFEIEPLPIRRLDSGEVKSGPGVEVVGLIENDRV